MFKCFRAFLKYEESVKDEQSMRVVLPPLDPPKPRVDPQTAIPLSQSTPIVPAGSFNLFDRPLSPTDQARQREPLAEGLAKVLLENHQHQQQNTQETAAMVDLIHFGEEVPQLLHRPLSSTPPYSPTSPYTTIIKTDSSTQTNNGTPECLNIAHNTPTQEASFVTPPTNVPSPDNIQKPLSPHLWVIMACPTQTQVPYGIQPLLQHQQVTIPPQKPEPPAPPLRTHNVGHNPVPQRRNSQPALIEKNAAPQAPAIPRRCKYCGEVTNHGMRNCPLRPRCLSCNKRGHIFRKCYLANDICARCKQRGHTPSECPKISAQMEMRCPFCKEPHWGKDCLNDPGVGYSYLLDPKRSSSPH
jgi:hypothetical protein